MAAEYTPILEGSNFGNKTAKKFVLPPKFQKVRFEMHKKFTNFQIIHASKAKHAKGVFGEGVRMTALMTSDIGAECRTVGTPLYTGKIAGSQEVTV